MDILLLLGISIFLGTLGGRIFQKFKIPQVVGYIIIGLILGKSFFGIFHDKIIEALNPFTSIALGIIGFVIGSELKFDVFKKYGCSIYSILLSEGIFTFVVVGTVITLLTQKLYLGLLFGALASATAPAATVDVLWEYKSRGPLTTTLLAIVALDDALALIIYGFASVFAKALILKEHFSILHSIEMPFIEIGTASIIGITGGYALFKLISFIKDKARILPFSLGIIILTAGLSNFFKIDLILSSMILGATLVNLAPKESEEIFSSIKVFSPPIYVLFFIMVGARLDIKLFTQVSIVVIAVFYVLSRTFGKMAGAFLGGIIGRAQKVVTKYLGLCLFSQAGVAIGLAISIYHNLSMVGPEAAEIGLVVINVIAATTFIVQLIGPPSVKLGIKKAGEMWRDVTENDIIESYKVGDVMREDFSVIKEEMPIYSIVDTFKKSDSYHICVVDKNKDFLGIISLGELRSAFMEQELDLNNLVLAGDMAEPATRVLYAGQPLKEAIEIFRRKELDFMPVLKDAASRELVGVTHYRSIMKKIDKELLARRGNF
jgi:Kef-type K+ transport system membrane component KefB/CBS domain-containing protein